MSYTAKTKGDKRVVEGYYIPSGHSCKCKACNFTIEVPKCTTDEQIAELVKKVTER